MRTSNRVVAQPVESLESRRLLTTTLSLGAIDSSSISTAGEIKKYYIAATKGADIEINTLATPKTSGFIGDFVLDNPQGGLVRSWTGNSIYAFELQDAVAGNYTFEVADLAGKNTGSFSIGLEGISPINPSTKALVTGSLTTWKLSTAMATEEFTFSLGSQAVVSLVSGGTAIDTGFIASYTLFASSGAQLKSWSGNNNTAQATMTLAAGKYMIMAKDNRLAYKGSVALGIDLISSPFSSDVKPLTKGGITSSEITGPLVTKEYTFSVSATTGIQFRTDSSAIDQGFIASFHLFTSKGASVGSWSTSSAVQESPVSLTAGTYLIVVDDLRLTARGDFSIGCNIVSSPFNSNVKPLQDNTAVSGSISAPLAVSEFDFVDVLPAAAFNTSGATLDSGYLAQFSVFDSSGKLIKSWEGNNTLEETVSGLTPGKSYVLEVGDGRLTNRGSFKVIAENVVPQPAPSGG